MKGFVYYDIEGKLIVKNYEFIKNEQPNFFGENKSWVQSYWEFDTEDKLNMKNLFRSFSRLDIPLEKVKFFCEAIGVKLPNGSPAITR